MKKTIHDIGCIGVREAILDLHRRGLVHGKSVDIDMLTHLLLVATGSLVIGTQCSLESVERFLRSASEPIWGVVGDRYDPMTVRAPEPSDEAARRIYDVLLAARGRVRMARDHVVHIRELSAITGLDPSYLRRLVRAGELVRAGSQPRAPIDLASAEKLLSERRIPPFNVRAA